MISRCSIKASSSAFCQSVYQHSWSVLLPSFFRCLPFARRQAIELTRSEADKEPYVTRTRAEDLLAAADCLCRLGFARTSTLPSWLIGTFKTYTPPLSIASSCFVSQACLFDFACPFFRRLITRIH